MRSCAFANAGDIFVNAEDAWLCAVLVDEDELLFCALEAVTVFNGRVLMS